VSLGDITGDGKPDLIVANYTSNNLSVHTNAGNGTFLSPALFATGAGPRSVVFADLDGDGKRDVLTANSVGNSISALLNRSGANCGAVQ